MKSLKNYLQQISTIRRSGAGVKETSYYGTLENLLNEIGHTLKPKVRCIINLQNRGAGIPDGGFFTPSQFQKKSNELIKGLPPERGAIEVKPTNGKVEEIAKSAQVVKYLKTYKQVLVTNYRDFLLVVDDNGTPHFLESYSLAADEREFWDKADRHSAVSDIETERFTEFLKRVMLHLAPLEKPEDVAWFLASYARDAKARVELTDLSALDTIRHALEESLGVKFEGEKGENFFRSTLVQTLFYGIFSAWVLWHKRNPNTKDEFRWKEAVWELRVPMISVLFEQVATPSNLKQLDLVEVLDWTGNVLNRVSRQEFFSRFAEEHAVQYFYEPFLQAFDPNLRKELGVWYTPPEIVEYMVERVDRALREELNLPDGLADESVYVLDPACGTGAYLVEVLRRINRTLEEKGEDSIRGQKLKKAVQSRVFGFEILSAPFVVSHLQIGLLLEEFGAVLREGKDERVGVFLTNSLTGWDETPKNKLPFPEFEEERDSANKVKKEARILVVLGNPPYNAFAGVSPEEENGLVEPYKKGLISDWGIKKFNLDDFYVRFFRLAERKIAEQSGKGIVCFISNFSYLGDPSFVVMRQKFLKEFNKIQIDCLNGDSRETGKLTPEGNPDPSVFSTEFNREGIRKGTAISLLLKKESNSDDCKVFFRQFWGTNKRNDLLETLNETDFNANYNITTPDKSNRYSFRPSDVSNAYQLWTKLSDLAAEFSNGVMEKRGGALFDIDKGALELRMQMYFDKAVDYETVAQLDTGLTRNAAGFEPRKVREKLQKRSFQSDRIVPYSLRPFDSRWCYYSEVSPLWNRSRPTLWQHFEKGNSFIVSRPGGVASPEGEPIYFTNSLGDNDSLKGHAYYFPFFLHHFVNANTDKDQRGLYGELPEQASPNLSTQAREYLTDLGFVGIDQSPEKASLVWYHALAVGYSSDYLKENEDGIRQDFPRIPLPAERGDLLASAELGKQISALLNTAAQVVGVTTGRVSDTLRTVGVEAKTDGSQFQEDDFILTAGWGHAGKEGVTMPGKGKSEVREFSETEKIEGLGSKTYDVYLNNIAYWRNVPEKVWEYYIGGYQVIKKWLSYREFELLGRALTLDEVTEVTNMIRRISAIVLLEPQLNENYQKIKKNFYKA